MSRRGRGIGVILVGIGEHHSLVEEFLQASFERWTEALKIFVASLVDGDEQDKAWFYRFGVSNPG